MITRRPEQDRHAERGSDDPRAQPTADGGPAAGIGRGGHVAAASGGARVHLAIAGIAPARLAIEAALQLARELGEAVDCVFVEHTDLFRAAALPYTREVGVLAPGPRRFEPHDLIAALRRQAEQTRRELEQAARRFHVQCSFEVVRGELLRAAIDRSRPDEVLVVGAQGLAAEQIPLDPERMRAALERALGCPLPVWRGLPQRHPLPGGRHGPPLPTPRLLALRRTSVAAVAPELERALRRLGGTFVAGPDDDD